MKHPNANKPGGIVSEATRMNEQKQVEKKRKRLGPKVDADQSIQARFRRFHEANPEVYEALVRMARRIKASGQSSYSISGIYEVARYDRFKSSASIEAGYGIQAGYSIEARESIEAGAYIKAGESIEAGWCIEAGDSIEADASIEAGSSIKAGKGIRSGLSIRAGFFIECKTLIAGLPIFAGTVTWTTPDKEDTQIRCEQLHGKVACGELILKGGRENEKD